MQIVSKYRISFQKSPPIEQAKRSFSKRYYYNVGHPHTWRFPLVMPFFYQERGIQLFPQQGIIVSRSAMLLKAGIFKEFLPPLAAYFATLEQLTYDLVVILQGKLPKVGNEHLLAQVRPTARTLVASLPQYKLVQLLHFLHQTFTLLRYKPFFGQYSLVALFMHATTIVTYSIIHSYQTILTPGRKNQRIGNRFD